MYTRGKTVCFRIHIREKEKILDEKLREAKKNTGLSGTGRCHQVHEKDSLF